MLQWAVGGAAINDQFAFGLSTPFAKHDERALRQQVGQVARLYVVHIQPFKMGAHVGQHGRLNHGAKALGLCSGLLGLGDDEGLAHTGAGQAFH